MGGGLRGTAWLAAFLLLAAVMTACQERLTAPADCPELCPGGDAQVKDVVLDAIFGGDSSYQGYINPGLGNALLVSNGLPASENRAVFRFVARPDSLPVQNTPHAYAIDSVLLTLNVVGRDTLMDGLKVFLYRLPPTIGEGITFADVDTLLVEANLIDSILVPDSLNAGTIHTVLEGDELARVDLPVGTGGVLALGVGIAGPQATGIRLGSAAGGTGASFVTYVTVDVADTTTAVRKQAITRLASFNTYVTQTEAVVDTTLLTVGGAPSSRTLLRFDLPQQIRDSATIVRATLELVPSQPILGVPTDPALLTGKAVLADLGAKSPVTDDQNFIALDTLSPGTADTVKLDVTRMVRLWQSSAELPQALFLSLLPEAATFMRAEFGSSRRPEIGVPRLRITYQAPFPFENP
jgi:hypothetical protein